MITNTLMVGIISMCAFAFSALVSYTINDNSISDTDMDVDIAVLRNDLELINQQLQALQSDEDLMPITQSWLQVLEIVEQYPDLVWHVDDSSDNTETRNAWRAVMIASPDLVLPVMRLIQSTVPAEVSDIQLNQRQGVLSLNILGVVK